MSTTTPRVNVTRSTLPSKASRALIILVIIVVLLFAAYNWCTARVPTGYTGIVTTFGRVENYTLDAGFHLKNPFQQVILMDNREQKTSFNTQSFSSDIQQVDIVGSINYSINQATAMNLYKQVGTNYFNTLVMPRLLENTKAVFSKYTAENLVSARETLSETIQQKLSEEMGSYGINVISLSIENIDFTDSFTNAVEQKQVAAQKRLQAEIEQKQKTMEAEQQAERERISAEAAANVKKINAEADASVKTINAEAAANVTKVQADADAYATKVKAEAEAEANRQIGGSLTDGLIRWNEINNWNGQLPTYFAGDAGTTLPILNLGK